MTDRKKLKEVINANKRKLDNYQSLGRMGKSVHTDIPVQLLEYGHILVYLAECRKYYRKTTIGNLLLRGKIRDENLRAAEEFTIDLLNSLHREGIVGDDGYHHYFLPPKPVPPIESYVKGQGIMALMPLRALGPNTGKMVHPCKWIPATYVGIDNTSALPAYTVAVSKGIDGSRFTPSKQMSSYNIVPRDYFDTPMDDVIWDVEPWWCSLGEIPLPTRDEE